MSGSEQEEVVLCTVCRKLQNSSPEDMTNTRNLPGSKEAAAWKSKPLRVAVKTQRANLGITKNGDSSRDVF